LNPKDRITGIPEPDFYFYSGYCSTNDAAWHRSNECLGIQNVEETELFSHLMEEEQLGLGLELGLGLGIFSHLMVEEH